MKKHRDRVSTSTKLPGTNSSDAISGQRGINRRGLDQDSGQHG